MVMIMIMIKSTSKLLRVSKDFAYVLPDRVLLKAALQQKNLEKDSEIVCEHPGGGGVIGLRTYGEVPLENLKSYPVPESNS